MIGSVAVKESEATRDPAKKDALWQVVAVHLPEVWPQPEQRRAWDERTDELMKFHRKWLDCRLLAEAELVGSAALITCDRQMIRRLAPHAQIRLLTPSAWWEALAVPRGTGPKFAPAPDNPLSRQTFWRWD